jgi:hypothetical protein
VNDNSPCSACSTCAADEYQATACTGSQDTICTAKTCANVDGAGTYHACGSGYIYMQVK